MSLALLTVAGLWYLIRHSDWAPEQRAEFYLAFWLAAGLAAELATAHPTFERYFLVMVPFLAIPAIAGPACRRNGWRAPEAATPIARGVGA